MSVIPSPWHILVCALREVSSGEFDRTEDGKSVDSAPRSQGRSCKVDRVVKATVPIRFQWMLRGGGGSVRHGGGAHCFSKGHHKPPSLEGCGRQSRLQIPGKPGPWNDQEAGPLSGHTDSYITTFLKKALENLPICFSLG